VVPTYATVFVGEGEERLIFSYLLKKYGPPAQRVTGFQ
jgi:hypothetical protein